MIAKKPCGREECRLLVTSRHPVPDTDIKETSARKQLTTAFRGTRKESTNQEPKGTRVCISHLLICEAFTATKSTPMELFWERNCLQLIENIGRGERICTSDPWSRTRFQSLLK